MMLLPAGLWIGLTGPVNIAHAQETDNNSGSNNNSGESNNNSNTTNANTPQQQALQAVAPVEDTQEVEDDSTSNLVGDIVECSISGLLSNVLTNVISDLLGSVLGNSTSQEVPVDEGTLRAKGTGETIYGLLTSVSWDALAYCLGNQLIYYVAQSTLEWINRGFDGNPVFVTDPSGFFQGIADFETENFIRSLGGGGICSEYQQGLQRNLSRNYLQTYDQRASCTYAGDLTSALSGDSYQYGDYLSLSRPENNYYGALLLAQRELNARTGASIDENRFLLDIGRGFLSHRDPTTGLINTLGSTVADQVAERVNTPNERLIGADEFDEIVTVLVDSLIRVALNEVLQTEGDSQYYQ